MLRLRAELWLPSALLSLVVVVLYAPSAQYGLIWDDPSWYWQSTGPSLWHTLTSLSSFQFFRPLTVLLNRWLVAPNGVVNVRLAHDIQILCHLLVTLISAPTLRILGFSNKASYLAAAMVAVHPFSYQAVAWQAPQQPLTMTLVLTAFLCADRYYRNGSRPALALSGLVYAVAVLTQESAVPFSLLFLWFPLRGWNAARADKRRYGVFIHLAIAAAFAVVWVLAPKRDGIRGEGFQTETLIYLVQGVVFPIARMISSVGLELPLWVLAVTLFFSWFCLVLVAWKTDRGKGGLVGSLLILLGIAPVWAGLSWEYARIGSRLLYPATLGIGALWGRWLAWSSDKTRAGRFLATTVGITVLLMSLSQWARFSRLYDAGITHLDDAVSVMAAEPAQSLLFVNYPDRMALRPQLYPLGYWGLTLAPIAQPLSYYALAAQGHSADARCAVSFVNGHLDREQWPYAVELRGVGLDAEALYEQAKGIDAIYLTEFGPHGQLTLRRAGSVTLDDERPGLARFGEHAELLDVRVAPSEAEKGELNIDLAWRVLKPLVDQDTLFLHVLTTSGEYVQGKDGDPVGELLPMSTWTPGWVVNDRRQIPLDGLSSGDYAVTIGIYNRISGERYVAHRANGERVPMGELQVHALSVH